MNEPYKITFLEIVISVYKETDETFTTFFSNSPGKFANLQSVKPIQNNKTQEEAIEKGKKFVSDHQWEYTGESIGFLKLYIRNWWDGDWGYRIGDSGNNQAGFKTRDEALSEGKITLEKLYSEL